MYIPFSMSPAPEIGPAPPIIHARNPSLTLDEMVVYSVSPNMTAIGANTIFTTEANRGRFFPVDIWFYPTVAGNASSTPQIRIGYTNSGTIYSDWVTTTSFLSSLAVGQYFEIPLKSDAGGTAPTGRYSAPPSTAIVFYVSLASAGPCAGVCHVRGFYA